MRLELESTTTNIWTKAEGLYGISVKNTEVMYFLNRITGHYPKGTKFMPGDEPRFIFTAHQIKTIASRSANMKQCLILAGWAS